MITACGESIVHQVRIVNYSISAFRVHFHLITGYVNYIRVIRREAGITTFKSPIDDQFRSIRIDGPGFECVGYWKTDIGIWIQDKRVA
jgi:hypothetical protein